MRRLLALLLLLLPISLVQAQGLDIGLVSGNEGSLPIAVVPMQPPGSVLPGMTARAMVPARRPRMIQAMIPTCGPYTGARLRCPGAGGPPCGS